MSCRIASNSCHDGQTALPITSPYLSATYKVDLWSILPFWSLFGSAWSLSCSCSSLLNRICFLFIYFSTSHVVQVLANIECYGQTAPSEISSFASSHKSFDRLPSIGSSFCIPNSSSNPWKLFDAFKVLPSDLRSKEA